MENNQINNSENYVTWDEIAKTKILKWGRSWTVIVLALLLTGIAIFSLVDFLNTLKGGGDTKSKAFSIIIGAIPLLLNILCSAGVWQIFVSSLMKRVTPTGAKLVKFVWQFYQSIVIILLVLIDIILIIICAVGTSFITNIGDSVGNVTGNANGDVQDIVDKITSNGTVALIVIVLICIVLSVLLLVFMFKVTKFAKSVCYTMLYCKVKKVSTIGASIVLFIIGVILIVSAFSLQNDFKGIFRALLSCGSFIFLGIIALQFGALYDKVELEFRVHNENHLK